MKSVLCVAIFVLALLSSYCQDIVINEFMALNNSTIQDEEGDYSDWIELYNTSNNDINLHNYSLSDDINELDKWTFPEVHISAHSFLIIFASNKNRLSIPLHANFKISSSGEGLFLTNDSGTIVDSTSPIALSGDESFSRIPDGGENWIETTNPSPEATNNNITELAFSHQEGFYNMPFTLSINATNGDSIHYTLNGDLPTSNSSFFSTSIPIQGRNSEPNIISEIRSSPEQGLIAYPAWQSPAKSLEKATVLRCAAFKNGQRTSRVYTKTFFVNQENANYRTLPIISLVSEKSNLFDENTGIYVPGIHYDSQNPEWTGNYFMHGEDWERSIHVEYFEPDGHLGFAQDAGIRIHGGKTRQAAQKSMRLYARNEYGTKYFNYNLLPKRQTNEYKRFLLRTSMGDWGTLEEKTMIKDILAQSISASLDIDYQEFQPVIVFLNGEYWGIHTIRDRIDERYIAYTHKLDKDSVEFYEWGNVDYHDLLEFIENNSLENQENFAYVESQIDVNNYIDYVIAELFFNNYDWPANNMRFWRATPEGKWRWVFYDIDAGFGNVRYNMFEHATKNDPSISWPNSPTSTFLFRSLLKNDAFKLRLIERYTELLNTVFSFKITSNKLDSIKELITPEIENHIGRWNVPNSIEKWEEDLENEIRSYLKTRPCIVSEQLMSFFNLTSLDHSCEASKEQDDFILAPNPNTGNFFLSNSRSGIIDATILIHSLDGQLVFKKDNVNLDSRERIYFELSYLSTGLYVISLESTNNHWQAKFTITN